jgi:hypothetical protein
MRPRFWLEVALAILTATAAIATIMWPEWIELLFGIEADESNGTLELGVTLLIAIVSTILAMAARTEWQRGWRLARD